MFPPLLFLLVLVALFVLHAVAPLPWPAPRLSRWVGGALILAGAALAIWARVLFERAGTNVNPGRPVTKIVIRGPYRFSRNPMYVAMLIVLAGAALALRSSWGLPLILVLALVLHFGIVLREEAYLRRKFGREYDDYRQRVRRWV